jgi:hypothetical protein
MSSSRKGFRVAAAILGCSALAAGTTAAFAAADTPAQSDAQITQEVQQKLQKALPRSLQSIQVQTKDGVVTLSGRADTGLTELKALQVAKKVPGVADVKNHLRVLM